MHYLRGRLLVDERGAYLFRYAVIIAAVVFGGFLAFTTIGQAFVDRVWALGQRIAQA